MKFLAIAMISILLTCSVLAGWERIFGGAGDEQAFDIVQTADGGFLIAGVYNEELYGQTDALFIKIDSSGELEWQNNFGSTENDCIYDIAPTSDGNFIAAGYCDRPTSIEHGYGYLVKIAPSGDTSWTKAFGEGPLIHFNTALETPDGGYLVGGDNYATNPEYGDFYLVRTDINGDVLWTQTYHHDRGGAAYDMLNTSDGNYLVLGYKYTSTDYYQILLYKVADDGDTIWTSEIGGSNSEFGHSICATSDGGYMIGGNSNLPGTGGAAILVKTDSNCNEIWTRSYGGSDNDMIFSIIEIDGGSIIAAGVTNANAYGRNGDAYLFKTDSDGNVWWNFPYGGDGEQVANSLIGTPAGGFVLAGYNDCDSTEADDIYVIETDANGSIDWIDDKPFMPKDVVLAAYPNPFNSSIRFQVSGSRCQVSGVGEQEIEIFDLKGNRIADFTDYRLPITDYRCVVWRPSESVSSGIYIVRATTGERIANKKIVYLK